MPYASFTDALMNAKRASQLRGIPFSTKDVYNLQSGYMEGATDRVNAERSAALGEKTLAAQEKNWADTLAQEKYLAGQARDVNVQTAKEQMDAQDAAARKALYGNAATTGLGIGGAAWLLRPEAVIHPEAKAIVSSLESSPGTLPSGGASSALTDMATSPAAMAMAAYLAARTTGNALDQTKEVPAELVTALKYPVTGIPSVVGENVSDVTGIKEINEPFKFAKSAEKEVQNFFNPCIIITTATNPYSEEVQITREYRDKFLDADTLRGYYVIAEKVVPLMKKYPWFKKLIKRVLVDNLIEYGRYALEKAKETGDYLNSRQSGISVAV